jgi:hypothetical protein
VFSLQLEKCRVVDPSIGELRFAVGLLQTIYKVFFGVLSGGGLGVDARFLSSKLTDFHPSYIQDVVCPSGWYMSKTSQKALQ